MRLNSPAGQPYLTCDVCGVQLFFRSKAGINRLAELLQNKKPLAVDNVSPSAVLALYNRLEKLKDRRGELEQGQGIIFRNRDLENAIAAIDAEIRHLQLDLEKARKEAEKKK